MIATRSGSIKLFRFAGIQVYLHWSWFLVALYEIKIQLGTYSSPIWNVAEYLTLFAIVTMHEFGHALACRQVGGQAQEIVLWPLGGIAYVAPPQRAGPMLWSIAAGPLVNVLLIPCFLGIAIAGKYFGWFNGSPDFARYVGMMALINWWLLRFNVLPIYPLDGGQILRSLLWFKFGRARSLSIAATIGLVGIVFGAIYEFSRTSDPTSWIWTGAIALFLGQRCWVGFREAKFVTALQRAPRHAGFACPTCHQPPPGGPIWGCSNCHRGFDPFSTNAVCPHCQKVHPTTVCVFCGASHPINAWRASEPPVL